MFLVSYEIVNLIGFFVTGRPGVDVCYSQLLGLDMIS